MCSSVSFDTHAAHAGVPCLGDPHSQIDHKVGICYTVVPLGREGPRVAPSSLLAVLGPVVWWNHPFVWEYYSLFADGFLLHLFLLYPPMCVYVCTGACWRWRDGSGDGENDHWGGLNSVYWTVCALFSVDWTPCVILFTQFGQMTCSIFLLAKDRYSWRHERRKGQSQTKLTPGQEGARRSISCISAGIKQDVCFPAGEAVRMSAVLEALPAQGDWYANAGKVLRPACRRCLLHNVLVVTSWPRYVCVFIRSSEHRASYGLERCCRLIPAKNAAKIDRVCVFCWVNRRY